LVRGQTIPASAHDIEIERSYFQFGVGKRHKRTRPAFNTTEGWSRDVSEDIALELTRRVVADQKPLTAQTRSFVEFHIGEDGLFQAEAGLIWSLSGQYSGTSS
jgi:hypothetical protein